MGYRLDLGSESQYGFQVRETLEYEQGQNGLKQTMLHILVPRILEPNAYKSLQGGLVTAANPRAFFNAPAMY